MPARRQAADEFGNVDILWKGPLLENDREGQINVVQDFITSNVSGIVLAPLDAQALIRSVKDAKALNIPTVIFDSGLDDESVIVSYVATDNYKGGVMAARELGKRLKDKPGGAIILRYNPGSESTHQREQGFLETLAKEFPDVKVLSGDQYAGTTPEASLDKCQQIFQKYEKDLAGVFAVCEPNGTGMLGALEDLRMSGKVVFVSFDPSPKLIQAMRDGKCHGIVLQESDSHGLLGRQGDGRTPQRPNRSQADRHRRVSGNAREHEHRRDAKAAEPKAALSCPWRTLCVV